MVQDYIGALNVYLALPALGISGIGVPNLRIVAILIGAATLLLLERSLSTWLACLTGSPAATTGRPVPITLAGLMAVTLLAASPSFIFWSRQGIFVTNLTQPLTLLCIWQGLTLAAQRTQCRALDERVGRRSCPLRQAAGGMGCGALCTAHAWLVDLCAPAGSPACAVPLLRRSAWSWCGFFAATLAALAI